MILNQTVLPFHIDDVYSGFAESEGILSCDGEYLLFELQTKDAIIGILKSNVKKYRIPLRDIHAIEYIKKVMKPKINITPSSMRYLQDFPGAKSGQIVLELKRKQKQQAMEFISSVNLIISEKKLEDLENE